MKMLSLGIKPKDDFSRWLVGSDYELKRVVGSGSYGSVAEAVHKASQRKWMIFLMIMKTAKKWSGRFFS